MSKIKKPIPGFLGYYITSKGEVFSKLLRKRIVGDKGRLIGSRIIEGKEFKRIKTGVLKNGYHCVFLRKKGRTIHTLVLLAFVGPRPKGMESRHLDGNKTNNNLSNLKYGTKKENMDDIISHGTRPIGEKNKSSKLTTNKVIEIRKLLKLGELQKTIASKYEVTPGCIWRIKSGRNWSWLQTEST